jgi:hypothetical protein
VTDAARAGASVHSGRSSAASLSIIHKTDHAMPTHADSTHPTMHPTLALYYTTMQGLFGVYM